MTGRSLGLAQGMAAGFMIAVTLLEIVPEALGGVEVWQCVSLVGAGAASIFLLKHLLPEPVFEFLAHHILPVEIAQRRYRDICGDLNVIVGVIFVINLVVFDWMKDGKVMCVVAAGGAMTLTPLLQPNPTTPHPTQPSKPAAVNAEDM